MVLRAGASTGERLVIVNVDPAAAQVPEGVRVVSAAELSAGTRAWYHEEVAGRRWRISARSFFQARPDGAEALSVPWGSRWRVHCRPVGTSSTSTGASGSSPVRWAATVRR